MKSLIIIMLSLTLSASEKICKIASGDFISTTAEVSKTRSISKTQCNNIIKSVETIVINCKLKSKTKLLVMIELQSIKEKCGKAKP